MFMVCNEDSGRASTDREGECCKISATIVIPPDVLLEDGHRRNATNHGHDSLKLKNDESQNKTN